MAWWQSERERERSASRAWPLSGRQVHRVRVQQWCVLRCVSLRHPSAHHAPAPLALPAAADGVGAPFLHTHPPSLSHFGYRLSSTAAGVRSLARDPSRCRVSGPPVPCAAVPLPTWRGGSLSGRESVARAEPGRSVVGTFTVCVCSNGAS